MLRSISSPLTRAEARCIRETSGPALRADSSLSLVLLSRLSARTDSSRLRCVCILGGSRSSCCAARCVLLHETHLHSHTTVITQAELQVQLGGRHFPGSVFLYSSGEWLFSFQRCEMLCTHRLSVIWCNSYNSLQSKGLKLATLRNMTVMIQIHVLTQSHLTCICSGEVCRMYFCAV